MPSSRGFVAKQLREMPQNETGAGLPVFLAQAALKPFIDRHLNAVQYAPVPYRTRRGASASGIPARAIARICKVWIEAEREGALAAGFRQQAVAKVATIIYDGLAETGIIALVDEATGYRPSVATASERL